MSDIECIEDYREWYCVNCGYETSTSGGEDESYCPNCDEEMVDMT